MLTFLRDLTSFNTLHLKNKPLRKRIAPWSAASLDQGSSRVSSLLVAVRENKNFLSLWMRYLNNEQISISEQNRRKEIYS